MDTWICTCGHENTGNFCAVCGRRKPEQPTTYAAQPTTYVTPQTTTFAVQPTGVVTAVISPHSEENDAQMKKWGSSVMMLILAIAASVYAALALIKVFTSIKNGVFPVISSMVGLIIPTLVCAGAWKVLPMQNLKPRNCKAAGTKC